MKRKILAVILAVMMFACALPFGAFAANDSYIHNEILDNGNYYHMEYAEKENLFKNQLLPLDSMTMHGITISTTLLILTMQRQSFSVLSSRLKLSITTRPLKRL